MPEINARDRQRMISPKSKRKISQPYYIRWIVTGELAQIAAAVVGSDQIAACYTFGSPRVGNSIFDLWVKPPSCPVINYADIVPQVPFPVPFILDYRHSGDPRYMPDQVSGSPYRFEPNILQRTTQLIIGLIHLVRAGSILGIQDHQISDYCRKLNSIAVARSQSRST
jgi:triacylglycerol lipase